MVTRVSPKRGLPAFTDRRAHSLKERRKPLPWPKDKPFKILSLDGGGIRGVYAASILALIEKEITGGEPIADYFDTIAGTSTGGIIALGLGLKKSAAKIEKLYVEDGHLVFPEHWRKRPLRRWLRQLCGSLLDHTELERLLYDTFQDETVGDSSTRLVIPAFLSPKTQIAVLKTDHHEDFKKDYLMAAWEAARATSADPTFFQGHTAGDDYVFLDGGVWANNPIMAAIVDTLSAYDVAREQIQIFSIGTGNAPYDIGAFALRGGLFQWREIIKGAMFLTTDNAQAQACLLLGPENILRLEPKGCGAEIDIDDWRGAITILPAQARADYDANRDRIASLFVDKVAPRHRFYTTGDIP
ncbi:patatin-like phospholipase family protein [Bradyrhizobium septentrionale]|uniref:CBASS cGAMP-activated phospholipase n=1 Tax=Bradyrhizobium septentrionale TaxID=1404411 RepID=UPI001CD3FC80|nr:CBASS cGAMP-activated phospholipase [Bradyrhizobium septentrionale]UGY22905.1 patatin-like phospholipase family protein [Bradyrhizobium septentrionale]